eukprot:Rhum_TRINITY_DN20872_c0_g1::Rhum_TRINITY_DN20872_c0_g1_i1::g.172426::m.172426
MRATRVLSGRPFVVSSSGKGRATHVREVPGLWTPDGKISSKLVGDRVSRITHGDTAFATPQVGKSLQDKSRDFAGPFAGTHNTVHGVAPLGRQVVSYGFMPTTAPGHASTLKRVQSLPAYTPESDAWQVVQEAPLGGGFNVRVVCGSVCQAGDAVDAVTVATDTELAPTEPSGVWYLGSVFAPEVVSGAIEEHYSLYGLLPKGCVGTLEVRDSAGRATRVLCAHMPKYVDGFRHERRFLASTYLAILQEGSFQGLKEVAVSVLAAEGWSREESLEVLAEVLADWAELDYTHAKELSGVTVVCDTVEDAKSVAAKVFVS